MVGEAARHVPFRSSLREITPHAFLERPMLSHSGGAVTGNGRFSAVARTRSPPPTGPPPVRSIRAAVHPCRVQGRGDAGPAETRMDSSTVAVAPQVESRFCPGSNQV
ncbi:hypothetical protein MTP99_009920 [Tenebrio molitor]|nr:hypothetical protein MTP99_009920 [Tenebrio molitor]